MSQQPEITVGGESKPYEYVAYPKHVYHADGSIRLVSSEREHKALGKGWAESPADHAPKLVTE